MHRLNRAEYENVIHDLLALDIDSTALLPPDDESSGFDNIADVLKVSPSLMERYLSASWNISRMAVGNTGITPTTSTYRVRPDLSQDQHIDGLPLGTRGGMVVTHTFPLDGEYVIKVRLWRNTFDLMRGMEDAHQIEIAMDGQRLQMVSVGRPGRFRGDGRKPGNVRGRSRQAAHRQDSSQGRQPYDYRRHDPSQSCAAGQSHQAVHEDND
jgi:hypothetical protein